MADPVVRDPEVPLAAPVSGRAGAAGASGAKGKAGAHVVPPVASPPRTIAAYDGEGAKRHLLATVRRHHASANLEIVEKAFALAIDAHGSQVRASGDPYVTHPVASAQILAELGGAESCVVLGHGRPYLTAIVTGKLAAADVQTALDRVNETLPHYRRVRKFHVSSEPFTIESGLLTANQKLRRKAIEKHYAAAVQELYA